MNKRIFLIMCLFILIIPSSRAYKPIQSSPYILKDQQQRKNFHVFKSVYESPKTVQEENFLSFLKKTFNKTTRMVIKKETKRGNILNVVISVMSIAIIFLIISSLFIFSSVFIIKTRRLHKNKRKSKTGKVYLRLIADYLINKEQYEYPSFPKLNKPLIRSIVIKQIYDLSQNLSGAKQNKLLKLFRIRILLKHVLFNIAISGKASKANYLKLFSVILLNQYLLNKFYKYMFSKHNEVRRFAQLSLLNYNPDSLQEILQDYPYHLTLWDQIHFLEVIDRRSTIPPDFYFYLESDNHSVVIFALRMIRIFYQRSPKEGMIIDLLGHSNEDVRYEAMKTVSDLNIEGVNKILLAYLSESGAKYKSLIIEYLISNNMLDDNMILKLFVNEKKDLDRLSILQTLYNNAPYGKRILEDLINYTNEERIQLMCKHILENTI